MSRVLLRLSTACVLGVCLSLCVAGTANSQQAKRAQRGYHSAQQRRPVGLVEMARGSRWAAAMKNVRHRPPAVAQSGVRGYAPPHVRLAARQAAEDGNELDDATDNEPADVTTNGNNGNVVQELPPAEFPLAEQEYPQDVPPPPGYQGTGSEFGPMMEHQHFPENGSNVYDSDHFVGGSDLGCDSGGGGGCSTCPSGSCGGRCGGGCSTCWTPGAHGGLCGLLCGFKHKVSLSAGVHGFKGPVNRSGDGSFGFHEGINLVLPFGACHQFGWQAGFEGVHSNFHGADFSNNAFGNSTDSGRDQLFVTTALYRRTQCGIQFGVAWDYLQETWDLDFNVGQVRGQISWITPWCHEVGFLVSSDSTNDMVGNLVDNRTTVETTDYYTFFYKYSAPCGGYGRIFAGWTQDSNGLIGVDLEIPIQHHWAILPEFSYLVPDEGTTGRGNLRESWNVGISLVWYPGGNARANNCCSTRPLFRVANNGSLFTMLR